jgi:hypothetical protein
MTIVVGADDGEVVDLAQASGVPRDCVDSLPAVR